MNFPRLFSVFYLLFFFFFGCKDHTASNIPQKPLVLVSVAPYQFFVERIGGDIVDVHCIVPPDANAHAFEPTPRQAALLSKGKIWFRIGEFFEASLISSIKNRIRVIDLREQIDLLELEEHEACSHGSTIEHKDRHIWLSPSLAQLQARLIEQVLRESFPEYAPLFLANLKKLVRELETLDLELKKILSPVTNSTLLVSHAAFGYFCRDYGLNQLSVEFEEKEPRPKRIEFILKVAKEKRPQLALTLPQHNNKGTEIIAAKMHLPIQMIDPYSYDYFNTMLRLAHLIVSPESKPIPKYTEELDLGLYESPQL